MVKKRKKNKKIYLQKQQSPKKSKLKFQKLKKNEFHSIEKCKIYSTQKINTKCVKYYFKWTNHRKSIPLIFQNALII